MPRKRPVTRQQMVATAIESFTEAETMLLRINLRHVPRHLQAPIKDARATAKAGREGLIELLKADVPELPIPRSA